MLQQTNSQSADRFVFQVSGEHDGTSPLHQILSCYATTKWMDWIYDISGTLVLCEIHHGTNFVACPFYIALLVLFLSDFWLC